MNEPLPGKNYSLYEAIAGKDENVQAEIFDALVGVKFDYDGDGPDTIDEYNNLTAENIQKLKNAIKDGPESNEIMARMMTKYAGEHSYNIGKNSKEEGEPKGGLPDYLETSFGSKSKMRANNFVKNLKSGKKEIKDLQGNDFVLQADGRYKSTQKTADGKHVFRTPVQMMEQSEMDGYFPSIYKDLLNTAPTPADISFVDYNKDSDNDGIPDAFDVTPEGK